MKRRTLMTMLVTAAACGVATPAGAYAASSPPDGWVTKVVEVVSPYQDITASGFEGVRCDHFSTNDPRCRVLSNGVARWTGTMRGDAAFVLDVWLDETRPGDLSYEGFGDLGNHFVDVEIEGCGRGGFHMEEWDGHVALAPPAKYNVVTNEGAGFNRWRVRPGSGTGQLEGLSGSGVNNWTYHSAFSPVQYNNYGEGVFTGTFTCRFPAPTPPPQSTGGSSGPAHTGASMAAAAPPVGGVARVDGVRLGGGSVRDAHSANASEPTIPVRLAASPRPDHGTTTLPGMLAVAVIIGVAGAGAARARSVGGRRIPPIITDGRGDEHKRGAASCTKVP